MSSSSDFLVPDGQYPPFAVVTDYDHAAWIIIPTALGFVCTLFFAGVRILVRRAISDGSALDDYLLYGATGLAMIQSSLVLGACSNGLGKALDLISPAELGGLQNMYYTSNLFFIMAIGLAKISVVRLLHRISRSEQHRLVFNIATGLIGAWIVASVFALALQCDLHHPWISVDQKCPGMVSFRTTRYSQTHFTNRAPACTLVKHQRFGHCTRGWNYRPSCLFII